MTPEEKIKRFIACPEAGYPMSEALWIDVKSYRKWLQSELELTADEKYKDGAYCDSCGKEGREALDSCYCIQRDFNKYPITGFPEGDPRAQQLQSTQLI